jgi:4a-hydroxytetrahydrobiopterin dehydratase
MGGTERLTGEGLARRAAALPDWKVWGEGSLRKTFLFPDFKSALAFVNGVGAVAEQQGHHPDMHLAWGRVDVSLSTHDAGGLTGKDFDLAGRIDGVFSKR